MVGAESETVLPKVDEITIEGFKETFKRIIRLKESCGIKPILDNPSDLFERAKLYGVRYRNGAWGWASNIWHRSASGTMVINSDDELKYEHLSLIHI